ncbi:hypothetical protein GCM10009585_14870 [Brevibacterium paucivorans]
MGPDLAQQSQRAPQQGDPPPHRLRGNLPRRDAITRLLGGVLAEQTDEWAEGCRYLSLDVLARCRLHIVPTNETETITDQHLPALTAYPVTFICRSSSEDLVAGPGMAFLPCHR